MARASSANPSGPASSTPADRRGLTPLFWSHVRPYGEVNLDMVVRLDLAAATVPGPRTAGDGAQVG